MTSLRTLRVSAIVAAAALLGVACGDDGMGASGLSGGSQSAGQTSMASSGFSSSMGETAENPTTSGNSVSDTNNSSSGEPETTTPMTTTTGVPDTTTGVPDTTTNDPTNVAMCGNGAIDGTEQCDGANLNGETCVSQGFAGGGTLTCNGQCGFNTAQCVSIANPYVVCVNPNTGIPVGAPAATSGNGTPSIINVPAGGTITDVNVSITALHTWVGDLTWTLNKGATNRTLISQPNCSNDNIAVTLDDEAAGGSVQNVCNVAPPAINGTRTPFQTLGIFDNTSMVGNWTMSVNDGFGGDSGTFQQWCLTISWQ